MKKVKFPSQYDIFSVSASSTTFQLNRIWTIFYLKSEFWIEKYIISTIAQWSDAELIP